MILLPLAVDIAGVIRNKRLYGPTSQSALLASLRIRVVSGGRKQLYRELI